MDPRYDDVQRILYVGEEEVKVFRQPARDQERILVAFQEQGWAARIDDPLPPNGKDRKKRLHEVIGNLNRNQQKRLIRFRGDGTGEGILWELVT